MVRHLRCEEFEEAIGRARRRLRRGQRRVRPGGRAGSWPHDFVPVDFESSGLKLAPKDLMPSSSSIERLIYDATKIRWEFGIPACQRADLLTPKSPHKYPSSQQHVLSSSRLRCFTLLAALVVRSEKDDREADITVCYNLLNNRLATIRLLVENDRLKSNAFQEASNRFARPFVVTVNDEHLMRRNPLLLRTRHSANVSRDWLLIGNFLFKCPNCLLQKRDRLLLALGKILARLMRVLGSSLIGPPNIGSPRKM